MQFVSHIIASYLKNYKAEPDFFKEDQIDLYEKGR